MRTNNANVQVFFHSSREGRALRRALDPKGFTRNQAAKVIAATDDSGLIENFLGHKNKHVRRYAFHKLGYTAIVKGYLGKLGEILALASGKATMAEPEPMEVKQVEDNYLTNLATQYGEDPAVVAQIFADKGGDLGAVKRSLISRKSARTRAAKSTAA